MRIKAKSNIMSPPMDFLMATDTKAHQVFLVIGATFRKWFLVMNQGGQFYFPLGFASLAQRLFPDVPCAYLTPLAAVPLMMHIAAHVSVIVLAAHP